jgi:leucyl-tRNA synthetase
MQVWNTNGVEGVHRFLARAWRLFADGVTEAAPDRDQLRLLHLTIKRVRGKAARIAVLPRPILHDVDMIAAAGSACK